MTLVPYAPEPQRAWIELRLPAVELAKQVANTDFVPRSMRGNPAAIAAAILYGDEIGLGPMQSLAKIAVIDGKPSLAAEGQRALILSAGHEIWIEESTTTRATVAGTRRGSDQTTRVTWTLDDARRANLIGKANWKQYPRQMLVARASAELARAIFADVIGGLPATEEILEDAGPTGEEGGPVPIEQAKGTRRRRRASATVTAPETPPERERDDLPLPGDDPAEAPAAPPEPEPEPEERSSIVEPEPPYLSDRDRRFLHARKGEIGMPDERLKDMIEQLTGQRSTTKVPVGKFAELLAAMQAWSIARDEAERAGPPPDDDDAPGQLDVGGQHEDRG